MRLCLWQPTLPSPTHSMPITRAYSASCPTRTSARGDASPKARAHWGSTGPRRESLEQLQRRLDPNVASQAALMLAIRRSGAHASYAPYREGERPWHSAMAATYVHATAPLRRLADRYVTEAALAVANGLSVPDWVSAAFERLPEVMDRADAARPGRCGRDRVGRGDHARRPDWQHVWWPRHRYRRAGRPDPIVRSGGDYSCPGQWTRHWRRRPPAARRSRPDPATDTVCACLGPRGKQPLSSRNPQLANSFDEVG